MASGATSYVRSLFVTLRRGMAGKPSRHRRVVSALGLRLRHHCVEKPNNESIRGMLAKIPHLVIVETDRMFYLRSMKQHYEQLNRDPWILQHSPSDVQQAQQHQHCLQQQQLDNDRISATPLAPSRPNQPRPAWIPPVTPLSLRIAQQQAQKTMAVQPLQSPMLEPHLREHMMPLPQGKATVYREPAIQSSISERLTEALAKRGRLIIRQGLYSDSVAQANKEIMDLRKQQVEEEEAHRQAVLLAQHTPGPHKAKVHASGRGSRRGMLAEAREQAAEKQRRREGQGTAKNTQHRLTGS